MNYLKIITLIVIGFYMSACSEDEPELLSVETSTINDLQAPQSGGQGQPVSGDFVKFNFKTGQSTSSDTDWDIAFRGTTLIINGGTNTGALDEPARSGNAALYIANGSMATTIAVDPSLMVQDKSTGPALPSGSNNGWYNYAGPPSHLITPIAGKVLVFRTNNGANYAKMEILSYYQGAPDNPDIMINPSRYYTFNYVYNPNPDATTF
ncbi:MAG: hypothetical protein ACI9FN_002943 [Saprospiraceae bacterium]|jgi:hypothetical protein